MDSYQLAVTKDFLEENWSMFVSHCAERDTDAESIIEEMEQEIDG